MPGKFTIRRSVAVSFAAALLLASGLSAVKAEPSGHAGNATVKDMMPVEPGFLSIPAMNIPVFRNHQKAGSLLVVVILDMTSGDAVQKVEANQLQLASRYAEALTRWASVFQSPSAPANVVAIKNRLQEVTNEVTGRTDVTVLLQKATMMRNS
jgi:hypothetical protein